MARLRANKQKIYHLLEQEDWHRHLDEIVKGGTESVGPLFALLPKNEIIMHRAALALGLTVAEIYKKEPEEARNIIRRFMWHMNEESGNIGWGIPSAFAETLAASNALAQTYASILISYIMDLGHDDNYCDHDILRRNCYWAVGRLAQSQPELAEKSRPWLIKGLEDIDIICRGMAAWALAQLKPDIMDAPALRKLIQENYQEDCEIFDGRQIKSCSVTSLAKMALRKDDS